jgi:glycosyltransferase involved in cell wall biosynthesis
MTLGKGPQKHLRVAVLNRIFSPTGGGAERYSIALVEALAERHEIHVFAQKIEHQWPGVTYHKLWSPLVKPRWLNQIWFAVTSWWATRAGFDVVHSHENTWHGQVQTVHVLPIKYNLFQGRSGWRLALRWFKVLTSPRLLVYLGFEHLRYALREGRRIVVTSNSLRSIMVQTYPEALSTMCVVTPGVKLVAGLASKAEQEAARRRLGLPLVGSCILFVGNDYKKKGLTTLIQALQKLDDGSFVTVVGHSAQIPKFRELMNEAGLQERIFFLGSLHDVSDAYVAADCLAHPTLEDTFAMAVLEAMAHGLPVVVSQARYCGISELLQHELNALILDDPRDALALSNALCRVLHEATLRLRLSEAAMKFAREHQWSEIALQQEAIYFSV